MNHVLKTGVVALVMLVLVASAWMILRGARGEGAGEGGAGEEMVLAPDVEAQAPSVERALPSEEDGQRVAPPGTESMPEAPTATGVAVILGTVVDEDGAPVSGASVVARGSNSRFLLLQPTESFEKVETITDEEGRFAVGFRGERYSIGAVAVDVTAGGFAPSGLTLDHQNPWESPMGRREVRIVLVAGVAVEGRVETMSGEPIAGERVYLGRIGQVAGVTRTLPTGTMEARTNAEGHFRFEKVEPGRITLGVSPQGMAPAHLMTEAPAGSEHVLQVGTVGARVVGFVYSEDTEEPLEGATVTVTHQDVRTYPPQMPEVWTVETSAAGRFEVGDLPPGVFTARPRKQGLQHSGARDRNARAELAAGQVSDLVELYLNTGTTLHGTVVDAETSRPMQGIMAVVQVAGTEQRILTDKDGDFTVTGLSNGYTGIRFEDGNAVPMSAVDDTGQGSGLFPTPQEMATRRMLRQWSLRAQVPVRGRVVGHDDRGVAGVTVYAWNEGMGQSSGHQQTEADGAFEVFVARNGQFRINVSRNSIPLTGTEWMSAGTEGVEDLVVRVGETARLRVRVADESGNPVENVPVHTIHEAPVQTGGSPLSRMSLIFGNTRGDGWTEWKEVPADVMVTASVMRSEAGSAPGKEVTPRPGESAELSLTVEEGREVTVRLVNSAAEPIDGMMIHLMQDFRLERASEPTGEPGMYLVRGLPRRQTATVLITSSGAGRAIQRVIPAEVEEITLTVDPKEMEEPEQQRLTVAVAVLDPQGELVPDIAARLVGPRSGRSLRVDPTLDGTFYVERVVDEARGNEPIPVEVSAPGFATHSANIRPTGRPDESGFLFTTMVLQPASRVTGRVVDAETREPVAGATVEWSASTAHQTGMGTSTQMAAESTRTGVEGFFELARLSEATTTLKVNPPEEYAPRQVIVRGRMGQSTNLGEIALERRADRTVRLVGPMSAISQRTVLVGSTGGFETTATTDDRGVARFRGAPPAISQVTVGTSPRVVHQVPVARQGDAELRVPVGGGPVSLRLVNVGLDSTMFIQLELSAEIEGSRVTASVRTRGFEPARVDSGWVLPAGELPPGTWSVQGNLRILQENGEQFALPAREEFVVRATTGEQEVVIDLKAGIVTGRVVDREGTPLPEATVALWNAEGSHQRHRVTTGPDGRFRLMAFSEGTELMVSKEGHGPPVVVEDWVVLPGREADLGDVVLEGGPEGWVVVEMQARRWGTGEPTPVFMMNLNPRLRLVAPDGTVRANAIPAGRGLRYDGLGPGRHILEFDGTEVHAPHEEVVVEVVAGEETRVTLTVDLMGLVILRAVGTDGESIMGAEWTVTFSDHPGTEPMVARSEMDADHVRITGIPHPRIVVTGIAPDGRRGTEKLDLGDRLGIIDTEPVLLE